MSMRKTETEMAPGRRVEGLVSSSFEEILLPKCLLLGVLQIRSGAKNSIQSVLFF